MDAYIYQAALLCPDCAKIAPRDDVEGPYDNGGGEADSPQHCDHCGVFLKNPLTADGEGYVREAIYDAMHDGELNGALVTWRNFYGYLFDAAP